MRCTKPSFCKVYQHINQISGWIFGFITRLSLRRNAYCYFKQLTKKQRNAFLFNEQFPFKLLKCVNAFLAYLTFRHCLPQEHTFLLYGCTNFAIYLLPPPHSHNLKLLFSVRRLVLPCLDWTSSNSLAECARELFQPLNLPNVLYFALQIIGKIWIWPFLWVRSQ